MKVSIARGCLQGSFVLSLAVSRETLGTLPKNLMGLMKNMDSHIGLCPQYKANYNIL
jgi:hypothetical protein